MSDDRAEDVRREAAHVIDEIVREAGGPRRAREELRRELESHFAEAGESPERLREALARFGAGREVGAALRRARGLRGVALYGAKVLASLAASLLVAAAAQVAVNLRSAPAGDGLRLAVGISLGMPVSALVVALAVLAWELDVAPLCARLERHPARLCAALAVVVLAALGLHALHGMPIPPGLALLASLVTVGTWACTIAIAAWLDRAYLRRLGGAPR